jgi:hypothetical protein
VRDDQKKKERKKEIPRKSLLLGRSSTHGRR